MVNAIMVNARAACVPEPDFHETFRVFGRFPRFKKSVKYNNNFPVNHIYDADRFNYTFKFNALVRKRFSKTFVLYYIDIEEAAPRHRKHNNAGKRVLSPAGARPKPGVPFRPFLPR
jgi:hypothetical protein